MESEVLPFQSLSQPRVWKVIPAKRLFDVLFSLSILVVLAPIFGLIALAIRISSGKGSIYVQPRLGQGGKVFKCYKFRTMYHDADRSLPELLSQNPRLQLEWSTTQKLQSDPRVFPIGKWLRKTSLDELPQFWNVVKGDLSVVGPRPYMITQKQEMGSVAPAILSVRPGITGLWQTSGRSRTTFAERVELDAEYVQQRSFWLDVKLILKTIPVVLITKDAC